MSAAPIKPRLSITVISLVSIIMQQRVLDSLKITFPQDISQSFTCNVEKSFGVIQMCMSKQIIISDLEAQTYIHILLQLYWSLLAIFPFKSCDAA